MKKHLFIIAGICVCVCVLAGAAGFYQNNSKSKKYQKQLFSMDTYMELTAYGRNSQQAVEKAAEEIQRLDALLSAQNKDSQVYALNQSGELQVSDELAEIISRGKEIFQETDGLFDDTVYPLVKLWGFPSGKYYVPSQNEIQQLLPSVDGQKVQISGSLVTLGKDQQIDLGGIAKGYTGEKLIGIFKDYGISSALVSLGGNIQAIGKKPDGSCWRVGIRDPKGGQADYIGVIQVQDEAVVTSGGYERYFQANGKTYIHIIDPRTGYPVENDLLSVTIVSRDGTLADGLSTALYIMGYEEAVSFWQQHQDEFDVILLTDDGQIHVSEKLQNKFQSEKGWSAIPGNDGE